MNAGEPSRSVVKAPAFADWLAETSRYQRALDPFGIGVSLAHLAEGWLRHPDSLREETAHLLRDAQHLQLNLWQEAVGLKPLPVIRPAAGDTRFDDPGWNELPFTLLKQYYLLLTRWSQDALFETPGVSADDRRRATFWARQWINAVAPSNFLLTNPLALKMAVDTAGQNLRQGLLRFFADVQAGDIQMTDRSAFTVGRDLATTPGSVVYRNDIMELIQYDPPGAQTWQMPIVIVPPWINKFYILDLTPKKSLVRYLLQQGHTVFIASWKNPTARDADTTFEDYLIKGAGTAIETARTICGTRQVHAVGYCLGGTGLATLMAWYNRKHEAEEDVPVAHWTLLTTLVDFSRPGAIEAFINEETIETLEDLMSRQGYLDGKDMGRTFRMLRSNSLIWHYFVHSYLYGEQPPPSDVLYWNTDATRLPRAMHSFYLRELYLNNRLVKPDDLHIAGLPIDLTRIRQPLYAVGCEEDHIAPWKASYRIGRINAPVRYTLSSSGHILGIINPPVTPPRRAYWTGRARPGPAEDWLKHQHRLEGSWWEDWTAWLAERSGPKVDARKPGSHPQYPALAPAPGTYVHEV